MAEHFADRLLTRIEEKGAAVCVGIDPVYDRLPEEIRTDRHFNDPSDPEVAADAIYEFCVEVLRAVGPHVPCVKFQSACFERYRAAGLEILYSLIEEAHVQGLEVILDAKRGDIGTSAAHYAAGCLGSVDWDEEGLRSPDSLTVNPYLGLDSLEPLVKVAAAEGRGLFALVRTSNPGGDALQSLRLEDGRCVSDAVADIVNEAGAATIGNRGYAAVGAVVGATKPDDAARLRQRMPQAIFLVPGFGAQGGTAEDVKPCFNADGYGALITASRSITYAFEGKSEAWSDSIATAALVMKEEIAAITR